MSRSEQSRAGFLLAGGRSSRMGTPIDKALMNFDGQTLLDRGLAAMKPVCGSVAIVGSPSKFSMYGSVVEDIYSGCGPLAGIHAALVQSSAELNLMLAVDMPFVSSALLEFLFAAAEQNQSLVTVPLSGATRQPLCAIYRRDFAPVAERALQAGNFKIGKAFSGLRLRVIEEAELAAAGFSSRSFVNLNTPQDHISALSDQSR